MSQKALAEAAEISTVAMYQIEAGKYEPRVCHLRTFAETLNVSMDYLAGRINKAS
jgi:transcriptional regulator with XRE-family HTH domain